MQFAHIVKVDNEAYWDAVDIIGDIETQRAMYNIEGEEYGVIVWDAGYELIEDLIDCGYLPEDSKYVDVKTIVIINKDITRE